MNEISDDESFDYSFYKFCKYSVKLRLKAAKMLHFIYYHEDHHS